MKHKRKRIIPNPNSYFINIICKNCKNKNIIFSHSQTKIVCKNCALNLCYPTGGKARLIKGCKFCRF